VQGIEESQKGNLGKKKKVLKGRKIVLRQKKEKHWQKGERDQGQSDVPRKLTKEKD